MAYEVTATRRRPQNFGNLVGQEFVAETLKNAIESKKIAHAYLFSGPRGCGKTSTARILAKALNCHHGPTADPCGECDACKEITAGSSLDVIEIDGASNTSVNDIRQIKDEVLFPPNALKYKIYIIDEVHMLSTSAFNALLKTIEEPPPYVIFIFATTELQKVPATIKSRCQQFNFRLVPIEEIKNQLAQAAQELGIKAEDEALYWIARESTGSMRDSYTLFDQVAAFSDGEITYEKIRDKLGLVGIDRLNELFGLCVKSDAANALSRLDEYLQNGVSIEQFITNCSDYLRSLLLIKSGITRESLVGQSIERYNKEVIDSWNTVQIERALSIFMQLYRDIRYSLSPRYELELAISRLAWLKDYVSPREAKLAVEKVEKILRESAKERTITFTKKIITGESDPAEKKNIEPADEDTVPAPNETTVTETAIEELRQEEATAETPAEVPPVAGTVNLNCTDKPKSYFMPQFSALKEESSKETGAVKTDEESKQTEAGAPVCPAEAADEEDLTPPAPEESFGEDSEDEEEIQETRIEFPAEKTYIERKEIDPDEIEVPEDYDINARTEVLQQHRPVDLDITNLESVKAYIIQEFNAVDAMLSPVLAASFDWKFENDKITILVDNRFHLNMIQNSSSRIVELLQSIYSRSIGLEVLVQEKQFSAEAEELPLQVQILKDSFKGSIV